MKIGIAGNGKIVHEMIGAIKNIQDLEIVAICSRPQSRQKAEEIADKFNIAKIYTDYNQMLEDGEIDFIYVAVANSVHYEYTKKEYLICGNGAADLIFSLSRALNPKKALLPAPTFAEYEQALVSVGCEISRYYLKEENDFCIQKDYPDVLKREKPDIIFLCNPNNPTGITIPQDLLEEILETCAMQGIFMVVDECFLDFVKDPEKHTLKGKLEKYPGLFILKAFTKRYAIPGVRLGYGFCSDRKVLDRMEAVTQPWNVSTMAQQAGMAALKEAEYVEAGRQIIFRESAWMKEKMRQVGLTVYPSEANYIFFYGPEDLFERCVAKGILIRDCSNYLGLKKGYYRVAVKLHEQNEKLIEVLEEVLS